MNLFRKDIVGTLAVVVLTLFVVASVFAPLIAPYNPNAANYELTFGGPTSAHWLGTDSLGRDLLSRVLFGGRVSLLGVVEALVVYTAIGLPIGLIAGYRRGWIEAVVNWVSDVSFALPQIVIVLAVLAIFSTGTHAAMIMLGVIAAPGLAVIVRDATRNVAHEPYVGAAIVSGLSTRLILTRHIAPRISALVIVQLSLFAGSALLFQTGLEFLGFGAEPPNPSWGGLVADGTQNLARSPWAVIPGGLAITLSVLAFSLIGDSTRDARANRRSGTTVVPGAVGVVQATPENAAIVELDETDQQTSRASASAIRALAPPTREVDRDALLWVEDLSVAAVGEHRDDLVPLIQSVSFNVRSGEVLGVVGESGSGKTLTAQALTGALAKNLTITSGRWGFKGVELTGASSRDFEQLRGNEIATISQEPIAALDPSFSVGAQLVEVIRRHSGIDRRAARQEALRLLRLVQLPNPESLMKAYPHQMSGGMAQRVSIAAALAGKPALLIADEPTTALDPTMQAEILDLLRRLRDETGLAIILVSHDWGVIADLCDTAVVMYAGEVIETADVTSVFSAARHPYTRGLIESNPHYATTPGMPLPMIPGSVPSPGHWPAHCHFAERCAFSKPDCTDAPIPEFRVMGSHWTRCLHHEEIAASSSPASVTGTRDDRHV